MDFLANRFSPEELESHEHLLAHSFRAMKKAQVQIPLEEKAEYSLTKLNTLVHENPALIKPITEALIEEHQSSHS